MFLWTCWMLFWGQWWNFTFKTSIKLCSNLEKKQQILQKRLVKVFSWKRKMQISQQLWKHFDKSSNKQLKIWIKHIIWKGGSQSKFFSLKGPFEGIESCSRTVVYLFSRKSEVFTQGSKSLRNLIFFQKVLRCYLQSRGALFWQQWRKLVGKKRIIST